MSNKPNITISAKSKASGKYQDIAAFWTRDKGTSGVLDQEVEKIVLKNGAVITNDTAWLNMKIWETPTDSQEPTGAEQYSNENTPF